MVLQEYLSFVSKTEKILDKVSNLLNIPFKEDSSCYMFFDEEASVDYNGSINMLYEDDKISLTFYITYCKGKYFYNYYYTDLSTNKEIEKLDVPIKKLKKETVFNDINKYYLLH